MPVIHINPGFKLLLCTHLLLKMTRLSVKTAQISDFLTWYRGFTIFTAVKPVVYGRWLVGHFLSATYYLPLVDKTAVFDD